MLNPSIFKAYDIRGRYPEELNEKVVSDIVNAYAVFLKPRAVVLGRDVRFSGPSLFQVAKKAFQESGIDVFDIGVVPVDVFYFAVGFLKADGGVFISASHNPREWNGLNLTRSGAVPISSDSGLKEIYKLAVAGKKPKKSEIVGKIVKKDVLGEYLDFVISLAQFSKIKPLKIVINGNFGVSAEAFAKLVKMADLPFELVGLNDKPDGSFPKGPPNPLLPENREEMSKLVLEKKADLGIAWDADGDRCFLVDEKGRFLEGYFLTAILAQEMLRKHSRATVMTDPRLVWAVQDAVAKFQGKLVISRPGMTVIAERMKKEDAVFAGEMSGHFYFHETFNRDNGFLPALLVIELMFRENKKLSEIVEPFIQKYFISGEINFPLPDRKKIKSILEKAAKIYQDGKIEHIDGLSVEYHRWRFNLRASNTEPLLRLNIEAISEKNLKEKMEEFKNWLTNIA